MLARPSPFTQHESSHILHLMRSMLRRRAGTLLASAGVILLFFLSVYNVNSSTGCSFSPASWLTQSCQAAGKHKFLPKVDGQNLAMSNEQCQAAFPGLFVEIERVVEARQGRKIKLEELEQSGLRESFGYVRAMIIDNRLYIIDENGGINTRRLATLHSLHLAIVTSPVRLPNSEFVLSTFDSVEAKYLTWAFSREESGETYKNTWLMPDFGHWSWPEPKAGSFFEALIKADEVDGEYISSDAREQGGPYTLHGKEEKLVWRGASLGLEIRQGLLNATKGKPWSDVKVLDWENPESVKSDHLSMANHCRYKFLAHVEGYSYSGRLKYLQACNSVIVAHKLNWVQHHHPLMISGGPEQNFVEVKRDWSDLEEKIEYLIRNPDEAEKIARRSREIWRRYMSPAATNCYWRRLLTAWGDLLDFEPQFYDTLPALEDRTKKTREWRGVPWESFALLEKLTWDPM